MFALKHVLFYLSVSLLTFLANQYFNYRNR